MAAGRKQPQRRERRRAPRDGARAGGAPGAAAARRVYPHPLYGDIPMIPGVGYDPDYRPPMPRGAVAGDVRKQHFCANCHVPRYFYVDQPRTCVECRRPFVFAAAEQKHWFEVLDFHFDSVAIRCVDCRRRQRSGRALHAALARAKARLDEAPADFARAVAVAEALVRLAEHTGKGDLDEAIALGRRVGLAAARAGSSVAALAGEALFWEGKAHALRGRTARARQLLAAARAALPGGKRGAGLRAEVDWLLAKPPP